jgi:small nuclear ribonucleoprotein (snRNP)-like protein
MTESEIQCLKDNIDKTVEIETTNGERLIAKVLLVTHDEEYDEHELIYQVVSSNMLESYLYRESAGGYVLDFDNIVLVRPFPDSMTNQLEARS